MRFHSAAYYFLQVDKQQKQIFFEICLFIYLNHKDLWFPQVSTEMAVTGYQESLALMYFLFLRLLTHHFHLLFYKLQDININQNFLCSFQQYWLGGECVQATNRKKTMFSLRIFLLLMQVHHIPRRSYIPNASLSLKLNSLEFFFVLLPGLIAS